MKKEDASSLRPAVFLDRDGTLMEEVHYCADPALVRLFPGTADALRRLVDRGFLCVLITNQSGIGRGLLTEEQYQAVQCEVLRQLGDSTLIAASYHCPDAPPPPSPRRKPEPGMVLEAARDLGIDLARSWFVGDKSADIECGARVGARTILVRTGYGAKELAKYADHTAPVSPCHVANDIVEAAKIILQTSAPAAIFDKASFPGTLEK